MLSIPTQIVMALGRIREWAQFPDDLPMDVVIVGTNHALLQGVIGHTESIAKTCNTPKLRIMTRKPDHPGEAYNFKFLAGSVFDVTIYMRVYRATSNR